MPAFTTPLPPPCCGADQLGFNILESWRVAWESATPPAQFLVTPAVCLPSGSELLRSLWVAQNRLRTGVGRFGTRLYRWGILDTPKCICGAEEQSANHIIFDCNILRSPNCLEDLRSPDINNIKWLEDLVDFVWTAAHTQEEEALELALSLFRGFVTIQWIEKWLFTGRIELDFGGIDCEFAGLSPLSYTSVERCHNFFLPCSSQFGQTVLLLKLKITERSRRKLLLSVAAYF